MIEDYFYEIKSIERYNINLFIHKNYIIIYNIYYIFRPFAIFMFCPIHSLFINIVLDSTLRRVKIAFFMSDLSIRDVKNVIRISLGGGSEVFA